MIGKLLSGCRYTRNPEWDVDQSMKLGDEYKVPYWLRHDERGRCVHVAHIIDGGEPSLIAWVLPSGTYRPVLITHYLTVIPDELETSLRGVS